MNNGVAPFLFGVLMFAPAANNLSTTAKHPLSHAKYNAIAPLFFGPSMQGSSCQQPLHHLQVSAKARRAQSRPAVLVQRFGVGSSRQQQLHNFNIPSLGGCEKRPRLEVVGGLNVGTSHHQLVHHPDASVLARLQQCCLSSVTSELKKFPQGFDAVGLSFGDEPVNRREVILATRSNEFSPSASERCQFSKGRHRFRSLISKGSKKRRATFRMKSGTHEGLKISCDWQLSLSFSLLLFLHPYPFSLSLLTRQWLPQTPGWTRQSAGSPATMPLSPLWTSMVTRWEMKEQGGWQKHWPPTPLLPL